MTFDVILALPTEDRGRAHAFARVLGLDTPGELAEDGVPEPLRVMLNERTAVMYIPTGGFTMVSAGRTTAEGDTTECLVSLQVGSAREVDDLLARASSGGAEIVWSARQQPWGYRGVFADPDGHLWEAIAPTQHS